MLKKVKNWLGIEGVKVTLETPETFVLKNGVVSGMFTITSLSEQQVKGVKVTLVEKYTRGRRKSKLIDEYLLGEMYLPFEQLVDKDKEIVERFELEFDTIQSPIDKFGNKNPLYKGIAGLARILKNAKSKYYLSIEVDVIGNKLKPYDKVEIVPQ